MQSVALRALQDTIRNFSGGRGRLNIDHDSVRVENNRSEAISPSREREKDYFVRQHNVTRMRVLH